MKRKLILPALCLALTGVFGVTRPALAADDTAKLDGPKIFEEDCAECHKPKKKPLDDMHMTRAEWKQAIDKMMEDDKLDPKPSKERIARLLDWLEATRGPVGGSALAPK